MQRKITIASPLLLLLLTVSLFINFVPVKALPTDLYNVFALKEYKQLSATNPEYTFSKSTSSVLQAMSTDPAKGDAYVLMPFDKSYLNGKKLHVYWRWYSDLSGGYPVQLAKLFVVDHNHNRSRIDEAEFDTAGDTEHPIIDYTYTTACTYGAICNGGWISWRTDTSGTLDLSSFTSYVVSVIIKTADPWTSYTTGIQVDYLQVLDASNNVLTEYHFTGSIFMERTDTHYDYGLIRKPSCVLWGTTDYDDSGGENERASSEGVSDYIRGLFYDTYKYQYLEDYFGEYTQPNYVYSSVEYSETYYDFSVFFYKGHFWKTEDTGDCGIPGCTYYHRGVVDDEGYGGDPVEVMKDYYLHDNINEGKSAAHKTRGTHDFVFLWACMVM